jgi:acetylornithine/N-succinyldiaminopimelate aminotransferase
MKLFDVYPLNPITIDRALGVYVWDDAGNKYLDFYGGHAVISIGHSHPYFVEKLTAQLNKLTFYSNSVLNPVQEALAEKLGEVSGKKDYALFLCNSGAEANENALKLASFHTGRKKVVAFKKAFHGRTSLAVAATDNPAIVAPVNQTEHIVFLPLNDEAALEDYFKQHGDAVAAVIIEGIQGVGGIRPATIEFMQLIRKKCDEYGAVYIADEIQSGYGRSGKFFYHDYSGINADIYTMAKGMGNGFPIGGCMIAPHIKPKHGMLGTTFGGNHLASAAGLAVLEVMEKENLIANAGIQGEKIMQQLKAIDAIKNVRGAGLMIGFDGPEDYPQLRKNLLMEEKVFTGESKPNVVRLLPALSIGEEEVKLFFKALKKVLEPVNR